MFGRLHRRDVQILVVIAIIAIVLTGVRWIGLQNAEQVFQKHGIAEQADR